jgi:hypothetical protein
MSTIDLAELAKHARGLTEIAVDAKVDRADGVRMVSYDQIHDHCRAVLGSLALAGHKRSHELLNPSAGRTPQGGAPNPAGLDGMLASIGLSGSPIPETVGDSKTPLSREAAEAVGKIGI